MKAIHLALVTMKYKLKKYYGKTHGLSVYVDSMILKESWELEDVDKYRDEYRKRFMSNYNIPTSETLSFSIGDK